MKQSIIRKTFVAVLAITVTILFASCVKKGECRNCTARYMGNTVSSKEVCNSADEQLFRTEYHYTNVTCE